MTFRNARLAAAGLALFAGQALAQLSSIEGYVRNSGGKPVANAAIKIVRTDVNRTYQSKTDKRGYYYCSGLPLGFYGVVAQVGGKDVAGVNGIKTQPGDPLLISFDLGATPQEQEKKIKQALTKLGAEWSYITIIPMQMDAAPAGAGSSGGNTREMTPEQKAAEARQLAERAAQMKQREDLNSAFAVGMAALGAKRYDEAVVSLTKASEVDPREAVVWANLASAYAGLAGAKTGPESGATMQKGLEAYAKAIELNPNDAATHDNYALALAKARKFPEMWGELKRAADLDPANAYHAYYNTGAVLTNAGQGEAAVEAFRLAMGVAPNEPGNAEAYYQYGLGLMAKAQFGADGKVIPAPGTIDALRKYLQLAPGGPNAQAAKELLATLSK